MCLSKGGAWPGGVASLAVGSSDGGRCLYANNCAIACSWLNMPGLDTFFQSWGGKGREEEKRGEGRGVKTSEYLTLEVLWWPRLEATGVVGWGLTLPRPRRRSREARPVLLNMF